jgi:hypothetical protein
MSAIITPVLIPKDHPVDARSPWWLTVPCCLYFLVLCGGMLKAIPSFAELFAGLGVDLPFPLNVLMATYRWSLPLFYLCAVAVAVLKQFVSLHGMRLRLANFTLIFAGILLPPLVVLCMYSPLFILIHKLHSLK